MKTTEKITQLENKYNELINLINTDEDVRNNTDHMYDDVYDEMDDIKIQISELEYELKDVASQHKQDEDEEKPEMYKLAKRLLNESEEEKENTKKVYKKLMNKLNKQMQEIKHFDYRVEFYENDDTVYGDIVYRGTCINRKSYITLSHEAILGQMHIDSIMDLREGELNFIIRT